MKRIQQFREISPREGPPPENFLRLLVDIHDCDARVRVRESSGPVTKTCIQRVEFQPLRQLGERRLLFLKKNQVVDAEGKERDAQAKKERDAVTPPRLQQFVEAEQAPPLPEPF